MKIQKSHLHSLIKRYLFEQAAEEAPVKEKEMEQVPKEPENPRLTTLNKLKDAFPEIGDHPEFKKLIANLGTKKEKKLSIEDMIKGIQKMLGAPVSEAGKWKKTTTDAWNQQVEDEEKSAIWAYGNVKDDKRDAYDYIKGLKGDKPAEAAMTPEAVAKKVSGIVQEKYGNIKMSTGLQAMLDKGGGNNRFAIITPKDKKFQNVESAEIEETGVGIVFPEEEVKESKLLFKIKIENDDVMVALQALSRGKSKPGYTLADDAQTKIDFGPNISFSKKAGKIRTPNYMPLADLKSNDAAIITSLYFNTDKNNIAFLEYDYDGEKVISYVNGENEGENLDPKDYKVILTKQDVLIIVLASYLKAISEIVPDAELTIPDDWKWKTE